MSPEDCLIRDQTKKFPRELDHLPAGVQMEERLRLLEFCNREAWSAIADLTWQVDELKKKSGHRKPR